MRNRSTRRRESPSVNAGSMADIAFLLLIFFLVTTQILQEEGLFVVLPSWEEQEDEVIVNYPDEQVLSILVNFQDQIMVEGQLTESDELTQLVIDHILDSRYAPAESIVSLAQDRGTSYGTYLLVYNEVIAAYRQLRDERAQRRFQVDYQDLDLERKRVISKEIPMVLSEAEPTDNQLSGL